LTRKAKLTSRKIHSCVPVPSVRSRRSLRAKEIDCPSGVASTPVAITAASMSSEPVNV